jgi:hypothetical protein
MIFSSAAEFRSVNVSYEGVNCFTTVLFPKPYHPLQFRQATRPSLVRQLEVANMHTIFRFTVAAVCIIALTWPFIFGEKPKASEMVQQDTETVQPRTPYNSLLRDDIYW